MKPQCLGGVATATCVYHLLGAPSVQAKCSRLLGAPSVQARCSRLLGAPLRPGSQGPGSLRHPSQTHPSILMATPLSGLGFLLLLLLLLTRTPAPAETWVRGPPKSPRNSSRGDPGRPLLQGAAEGIPWLAVELAAADAPLACSPHALSPSQPAVGERCQARCWAARQPPRPGGHGK